MSEQKFSGQMNPEKAETVEQRAYRFEGFPDEEQQDLLNQFIGAARFLWNRMLGDWNASYEEKGKSDPIKTPAAYKKEPGLEWMREIDALVFANVQRHFERAVKDFFSGKLEHPRFKKKGKCKNSYTTNKASNSTNNLRLEGCMLKLPKIKNQVRLRLHRKIKVGGILKNCTVTHEPNGKWYFALVFEYPKTEVLKTADAKTEAEINAIGLDMSLPELYVDSNNGVPGYPKPYRQIEARLKKEQRKLSKMGYDSNNYKKQQKRVAKLHAKAKRQRADFLHKLSYILTHKYDIICIEDLDMNAIKEALNFGKSVSDNGWGMFIRMLEYKADWYGCVIIKVDRWFPSSKQCVKCGHIHKELKLSDRTYICPKCGHVMDRDYQAAINIRNEGIRIFTGSHTQAA